MQVNSEIPLYKNKRMTYGYYLRANLKAAAVRLVNENVNKRNMEATTAKPAQQLEDNDSVSFPIPDVSLFEDSLEDSFAPLKKSSGGDPNTHQESDPTGPASGSLEDSLCEDLEDADLTQLPLCGEESVAGPLFTGEAGGDGNVDSSKPELDSPVLKHSLDALFPDSLINTTPPRDAVTSEMGTKKSAGHSPNLPTEDTTDSGNTTGKAEEPASSSEPPSPSPKSNTTTAKKVPTFGKKKSSFVPPAATPTLSKDVEPTETSSPEEDTPTHRPEEDKENDPSENNTVKPADICPTSGSTQKPKFSAPKSSAKKPRNNGETAGTEGSKSEAAATEKAAPKTAKKTKQMSAEEKELKKQEKERKKLELEQKKAERERLKEEKRLEQERKKAEKEQMKMEKELKKMERDQNKLQSQKSAKKVGTSSTASESNPAPNTPPQSKQEDVASNEATSPEIKLQDHKDEVTLAAEDASTASNAALPAEEACIGPYPNQPPPLNVEDHSTRSAPVESNKPMSIAKPKVAKFNAPKRKTEPSTQKAKKEKVKPGAKGITTTANSKSIKFTANKSKPDCPVKNGKPQKKRKSSEMTNASPPEDDQPRSKKSKKPTNYSGPVWVQCDSCEKWRQLKTCKDPSELPANWECSMNTELEGGSCSTAEEEWAEFADSQEFVESPFIPGSVVWAKMEGYPWWPAMLEEDPNEESYYKMGKSSGVPVKYHAVFLDTPVCRAWVVCARVQHFTEDSDPNEDLKVAQKYRKGLRSGVEMAKQALSLSIDERLEQFSFASRFRQGRSNNRKRKLCVMDGEDAKDSVSAGRSVKAGAGSRKSARVSSETQQAKDSPTSGQDTTNKTKQDPQDPECTDHSDIESTEESTPTHGNDHHDEGNPPSF